MISSKSTVVLLVVWLSPLPIFGQLSDQYRQAAQVFRNSAAQCQNPTGAACMRQYATYNDCLANQMQGGGSCGNPPTCSTSCTGASATGVGGTSSAGQTMPGVNPRAQAVGNLVGQVMSLLMNRHSNQNAAADETQEDPAIKAAELAAAKQQQLNTDAANLLQQSDSLLASINGPTPNSTAPPNAAPNLDTLFDSGQPSITSTSAITALLGDSSQTGDANGDSTSTIAGLLSQPAGTGTSPGDNTSDPVQLPRDPATASLAAIDTEEGLEAQSMGPDWVSGLETLKDDALNGLKALVPSPAGQVLSALEKDDPLITDPLKQEITSVIRDVLPGAGGSDVTYGSIVRDRFISAGSDKVADTLSDMKDNIACSGADLQSKSAHSACMVLMAPTNLFRGLYSYGKLLVNRAGQMIDSINSEFLGPTQ